MLKNLDADLQFRKIARLTDQMESAFGSGTTAFRAGRFGIGTPTVDALIRCGYRVDSSVMPWIDWTDTDDGPNFFGAPLEVYRLAPGRAVTAAAPDGSLIEVPLSAGFSRWPFSRWATVHRRLSTGAARKLHLSGIASRAGLLRRIMFSPEGGNTKHLLQLARVMVSHGVRHLQLIWHSPSLVPGLTPFTATKADVERLCRTVEEVVEGLQSFASVTFATVSETADLLVERPAPASPTR